MELKRVIEDSEIMEEDDALWPPPDRVGRQVSIVVLFVHTRSPRVIIKVIYCVLRSLDYRGFNNNNNKAVDERGLHGLACRRSTQRHQRHSQLNDIIWRAIK